MGRQLRDEGNWTCHTFDNMAVGRLQIIGNQSEQAGQRIIRRLRPLFSEWPGSVNYSQWELRCQFAVARFYLALTHHIGGGEKRSR